MVMHEIKTVNSHGYARHPILKFPDESLLYSTDRSVRVIPDALVQLLSLHCYAWLYIKHYGYTFNTTLTHKIQNSLMTVQPTGPSR